jgi:signal transduction histidine kinase
MRPIKASYRVDQRIKTMQAGLQRQLSRIGPAATTILLSGMVAVAALAGYRLLMFLEGQPPTIQAFINIPLMVSIVAAPLIFYARRVIIQLARSRAELEAMSHRLAVIARKADKANRAKSAFLANMSHELRTPLNAILGFSEIMKDQHLGPVQNARYLSYAADIHSSGRHLLGIINDVLDLAKIEAGKMSLDSAEEFALVPALSTSLAMLSGLGEKRGVTVREEWPHPEMRIVAVERMMCQIIINLVGNAIRYTPAGGGVVLSGKPARDGSYAISVRDNGVGMSEDEIANALTPFGQNHPRMTVTREGTGLGLPLAKAMAELHGGKLIVESKPGKGTNVTLLLPPERVIPKSTQAAA